MDGYKDFKDYQKYHINGWVNHCLFVILAWLAGVLLGWGGAGAGAEFIGLPVKLGAWLRQLSLSGGGGNIAAWAVVLIVAALPALGLLWKGRQKADWLLPAASVVLLVWLFYLVNPTMLGTVLPAAEGWAMCGLAAVGSLMVTWALLRLMKKLDANGTGLLPKILTVGAVIYAFMLGMGTMQQLVADTAAVQAANTADPGRTSFTVNTMWTLAFFKVWPALAAAAVVMWGGDLLRALEKDPFAGETVDLAEKIAKQCDQVVYLTLLATVFCNLLQMLRFSSLADVDVTVYLPVMTLALAAVLRTLCRYFRRAKAVSDDNDTII